MTAEERKLEAEKKKK
jgi:hypothetical protein